MTSRRIRVLTCPPLPSCRIWFLIPADATTIHAVKESICKELSSVLKGIPHASLTLQMDDFELPDGASNALLRDEDTVAFKFNGPPLPPSAQNALKRGADAVDLSTRVKKRKTRADSSTTTTTSSSSASSSSSSSSDSDSDSNVSSSSSFASPKLPAQHTAVMTRPHLQTVPPGMGKSSTHARNWRRRIKRKLSQVPLADQNITQNDETGKQVDKKVIPCIPPSQRTQLPPNIFVTQVNVEPQSYSHFLNEENNVSEPKIQSDSLDWDDIEMHWDGHKKIEASHSLKPGSLVAWKAFGLDPLTLTPQMSVLHIATIESVTSDHVIIALFKRPVKGGARHGMISLDEAGEELNLTLADVYSGDWRLLSSP